MAQLNPDYAYRTIKPIEKPKPPKFKVEVKASDGHCEMFEAPGLELFLATTEPGFVHVKAYSFEHDRENTLAIFYQPIHAKLIQVVE